MLTIETKSARLDCMKSHGPLLTCREAAVAMLDGKWFFKRNRRRKVKELPLFEGEDPDAANPKRFKAKSKRLAVEMMQMGELGQPRYLMGTFCCFKLVNAEL